MEKGVGIVCGSRNGSIWGLPDIAMLRVLEGWLDKVTKSSMHNKIKENPALRYSDFFLELCREFQVESNVTERNKWRDTTLKHKEGQPLFAVWRNSKATLSYSLSGVEPPQSEDLREYVLRQLPKILRKKVVWEEMTPTRTPTLVGQSALSMLQTGIGG